MLFRMTCRYFLKILNVQSFKEDSCFGNPNIDFPILANTEGQNNKGEIYLWENNEVHLEPSQTSMMELFSAKC